MRTTAAQAGQLLDELHGFVADYLAEGGPLEMLEGGAGGVGERIEFRGRPMFPERLHAVALAVDALTRLLGTVEEWFDETADEVTSWPGTTDPSLTAATRARLEAIAARRG